MITEEALLYHSVMMNMFLGLLFVNLLIPYFFRKNIGSEIRATRISFFLYSALLSMLAFTGIILFMLANSPWDTRLTIMTTAFFMLSGIEIARSIKLRRIWMAGGSGVLASWPFVLAEISVALFVVLFMMADMKDAVPV